MPFIPPPASLLSSSCLPYFISSAHSFLPLHFLCILPLYFSSSFPPLPISYLSPLLSLMFPPAPLLQVGTTWCRSEMHTTAAMSLWGSWAGGTSPLCGWHGTWSTCQHTDTTLHTQWWWSMCRCLCLLVALKQMCKIRLLHVRMDTMCAVHVYICT